MFKFDINITIHNGILKILILVFFKFQKVIIFFIGHLTEFLLECRSFLF